MIEEMRHTEKGGEREAEEEKGLTVRKRERRKRKRLKKDGGIDDERKERD